MNSSKKWKYPEAIADCNWLHDQSDSDSVRVYDCTTYLNYTDNDPSKPYDVGSGYADYLDEHIPGAAFLDLQKQLSNRNSRFSFTLPESSELVQRFNRLGVGSPFHIILYSKNGVQWATRIWWMLFSLGYKNVSILDGGLQEWRRLGYKTEKTENKFDPADFIPDIDNDIFIGKEKTFEAIDNKDCYLLNALTSDLHKGENPRYGRPGRIPKSQNIPFHRLVDKGTGKLITPEQATSIFEEYGISSEVKVVNYCGGGIAATLNAFVLRQVGIEKLEIYDNSMSEWATDNSLPIETD
jgi:thiosulfate/3-mercaptopyruvate sulfurtransferase